MGMSRRKFLAVAGGGVVVAAGAGGAGFFGTRTPHKALEPWSLAGTAYEEPRRRALSYALLAPNPHNQQPWIVDLDRENEVHLYADTTHLLPETDPFDRQITVGLGCFLELLVQAGAEDGYNISLNLFPEGQDAQALDGARPIAIARFEEQPDVAQEPLFAHVLDRRSLKEPFDPARSVSPETLGTLEAAVRPDIAVSTTNDAATVAELRELTWKAFQVEYTTPAKLKESIDVMRLGKRAIEANPDGIDLGGAFLEGLMLVGAITPETLADPSSTAFTQGLDMYDPICGTAQAYLWLKTKTNTRVEQIAAGRSWVRVNLAATAAGVSIHPLSQCLQEYTEMDEHYKAVHEKLAPDGETIQMLGRLGYAAPVPPSPRWKLEEKIRRA